MTVSPHRPPIAVEDLDGAVAALREGGLRISAVRRLVLEALLAADGPIPAEQIAASGSGGLDLASVYRNLETFEELGLVRHVHLGHGPGLYALSTASEREYLVCERCRRVTTVEPARLDPVRNEVRTALGFEARFSHFPISGLCARCREAEGNPHRVGHVPAGDAALLGAVAHSIALALSSSNSCS